MRFNSQRFTGLAQENSGTGSALEHTGASNVVTDTLSSQLSSTLSSRFVNTFRFGWQRDHEPGLANSINPEAAITQIGFTVGRNSFSPRETTLHRVQFQDTLTQVAGRHTLKYGMDVLKDFIFNYFPGNFSGVYSFASLTDFGNSLLGVPVSTASGSTYSQNFAGPGTTGPTTHPDLMQTAGFVQDDIRVRNNLTINAGVRYDYVSPKSAATQNPAALAFGIDTAKTPTDHNNVAPRVGFAWTPFRDTTHPTVVRGGFGMFYGNTPSIMYGTALSGNGVNVASYNYNRNNSPWSSPSTRSSCSPRRTDFRDSCDEAPHRAERHRLQCRVCDRAGHQAALLHCLPCSCSIRSSCSPIPSSTTLASSVRW